MSVSVFRCFATGLCHVLAVEPAACKQDSYFSMMKPTWCTFHSFYWESRASTCFEHYLPILRWATQTALGILRACNVSWLSQTPVSLQSWHSQLTLHAHNIPSAVCVGPPEDEQVMLVTCTCSRFSVNWMNSASLWFHYTDILWCTVSKASCLFSWL
jgi:hypothetical protein